MGIKFEIHCNQLYQPHLNEGVQNISQEEQWTEKSEEHLENIKIEMGCKI